MPDVPIRDINIEGVEKPAAKGDDSFIGFVLDRSGSMGVVKDATIVAFNTFLKEQKKLPGEAGFYLIQFDDVYEKLYDGKIVDAYELNDKKYVPRGGTALYDAMGKTITDIQVRLKGMSRPPEKIVVVTLTDGEENQSRNYSRDRLADLIKGCREEGWEFLFLGANQDAIMTGSQLSIPAVNSVSFAGSSMYAVNSVMTSTARNVAAYRATGARKSLSYSPEQREDALIDDIAISKIGKPPNKPSKI